MSGNGGSVGDILKMILSPQVLRRPLLVWEAVRTAWAFRARRGLMPAPALLNWRLATAYGSASAAEAEDLVRFLAWRRSLRTAS
ncbi:MAG: hypothetical protein WB239_16035 [Acidimicrobiia bacterium]